MPEETEQAERPLEAPNGADRHSQYLHTAAHDIRGAIANARASASFLLDPRHGLDEKTRRWAEMAVRNADKALAQLVSFFEWAQYRCGQGSPALERQPVLPVLRRALERADGPAKYRGIVLRTELPEVLPDSSIDADMLVQSTYALLEHGVDRTPPGEELLFQAGALQDTLIISVTDPSQKQLDFDWGEDPERLAISEGKLGTGFQLGLARYRIALMGGESGFREHPHGTTFYFRLPALQPANS